MNPTVKRIIRSIKYFFVFIILAALVICGIVLITPGAEFNQIFLPMSDGGLFQDGAFWKMLAIFFIISAIYPGLTFVKKEVLIEGDFEDHRDVIIREFETMGYTKTGEDSELVSFCKKSTFVRIMRVFEDEVTITKGESPLILNGNRKDILRLASHISYALQKNSDKGGDDPYDLNN